MAVGLPRVFSNVYHMYYRQKDDCFVLFLQSLDVTEPVQWGNELGLESVLVIIAVVMVRRRPTMLWFRLVYRVSKFSLFIACTFEVFIC